MQNVARAMQQDDAAHRNCVPANERIRRPRNLRAHTVDTQNNARLPTKRYRSKTRQCRMLCDYYEKYEATDRKCVRANKNKT